MIYVFGYSDRIRICDNVRVFDVRFVIVIFSAFCGFSVACSLIINIRKLQIVFNVLRTLHVLKLIIAEFSKTGIQPNFRYKMVYDHCT